VAFFGHNFELGDLQIKSSGDLNDYLPDLLLSIHHYFSSHVFWVELNRHLNVVLLVVLLYVFKRDVHEVEPVQVSANKREPIEPSGNILRRFTFNRLI